MCNSVKCTRFYSLFRTSSLQISSFFLAAKRHRSDLSLQRGFKRFATLKGMLDMKQTENVKLAISRLSTLQSILILAILNILTS